MKKNLGEFQKLKLHKQSGELKLKTKYINMNLGFFLNAFENRF